MTTQNSEPSSVPTCRADDFYCAPIYDPSATAIFIQPASGEEDAAWTNILVELFSIVWVFGFVELVLLWLITWPRRASLPGWRKMTWVLNAWIVMSAL